MPDLVSGRYYPQEPIWQTLGLPANATQPNIPARTNLTILGQTELNLTRFDSAAARTLSPQAGQNSPRTAGIVVVSPL